MAKRGIDNAITRHLRTLYSANRAARFLLAGPAALRRHFINRQTASAMRTAATAARRLAGDITLDLPEFGGRFVCSPQSHLFRRIILHDRYEPEVASLIRQHIDPARDMIDVGANIGFFSVLSASLIERGRVLSIEPSAEAFDRLTRNVEANGFSEKTIFFAGAAAAGSGEGALHQIAGKEEYASMAPVTHPATKGEKSFETKVATRTIDQLVAEHSLSPGLIKVDVEGAEALVLEGARETLRQHRPVVLCELAGDLLAQFGSSPEAVIAMLRELEYHVVDAADPARAPDTRIHGEILCLPR